jgi:hypothetical protein
MEERKVKEQMLYPRRKQNTKPPNFFGHLGNVCGF